MYFSGTIASLTFMLGAVPLAATVTVTPGPQHQAAEGGAAQVFQALDSDRPSQPSWVWSAHDARSGAALEGLLKPGLLPGTAEFSAPLGTAGALIDLQATDPDQPVRFGVTQITILSQADHDAYRTAQWQGAFSGHGMTMHSDTREVSIWQLQECSFTPEGKGSTALTLLGQGTTQWRDEVHRFVVAGRFDAKTGTGQFCKIHPELPGNRTDYKVTENCSGNLDLTCKYSSGTLILARTEPQPNASGSGSGSMPPVEKQH